MRQPFLSFPALKEPSRFPGYLYIILDISCIRFSKNTEATGKLSAPLTAI